MAEDNSVTADPVPVAQSDKTEKRERSKIQFPYNDLDDAVEVVKAIHKNAGERCGIDQLAAWMGHESVSSGTFRMKVNTARIFGLLDAERKQVTLTPLGRDMVHPERERQTKVTAFLHVPLYNAIFEKYRGYMLPPDVGLENQMVAFGVSGKQTDKARQAFRRSAEQAGFFSQGKDRLVLPAGLPTKPLEGPGPEGPGQEHPPTDREDKKNRNDGTGGPSSDLHPFIQGLLQALPAPGSHWPEDQQEKWLATAKNIFGLIYDTTE